MATIKAFKALRPTPETAAKIAALPYDVYNRAEATAEVRKNKDTFLIVDRAETTLDDSVGTYEDQVYDKALENLNAYIAQGMMEEEETPCLYLYELTRNGKSQTGIVGLASVDEYENATIKKHELTRKEKEEDRIRHVNRLSAHTGPIFLTYPNRENLQIIIDRVKQKAPLFDFVSEDGIGHRVFRIADEATIQAIEDGIGEVKNLYIADGHHRCASAVAVSRMRREAGEAHLGADYFLSVLFPAEELSILDYNRVVKDLNGYTKEDFLKKLSESYELIEKDEAVSPSEKKHFGMYLDGQWYELILKDQTALDNPVDDLDVSVLYHTILEPVLGIGDPRVDERIDFVGGIRGLKELEKRVSEDMKVAFSMYPTDIHELIAIADANLLMPPKSTWFEPKLRSGLFIHRF